MSNPHDYSPVVRPALPPHVELTPAAIRALWQATAPQAQRPGR